MHAAALRVLTVLIINIVGTRISLWVKQRSLTGPLVVIIFSDNDSL